MTRDRSLFIVWNPASGGKSQKIVQAFASFLDQRHITYTLQNTTHTANATAVVQQHMHVHHTDLIIVGGDGTIHEAINGLKVDVPVSIIPAGTGDDFAKMVNLGSSMQACFEVALNGRIIPIDLGLCNQTKFINGIGIGFDGQIVEDMITKRVPLLKGHAAYYYHVLRILGGYHERPFSYHLNGADYTKNLILLTIGNGSTFGGGFRLMPQAKIDDGLLEVCEIGKLAPLMRFLNIHRLSSGTHGELSMVNYYQTRSITIDENPALYAHIDGERLGTPPFHIKVLPQALQLRVS